MVGAVNVREAANSILFKRNFSFGRQKNYIFFQCLTDGRFGTLLSETTIKKY